MTVAHPTNGRYAKANGGLSRMLTGIGADGTRYKDGCTLASELALKEASPIITLPNDDDPDGEPVRYRLRLFLLLISCDWLAVGDFGPFAGSVSATRPHVGNANGFKLALVRICPVPIRAGRR